MKRLLAYLGFIVLAGIHNPVYGFGYSKSIYVTYSTTGVTGPGGRELLIGADGNYYVCLNFDGSFDVTDKNVYPLLENAPWDYVLLQYDAIVVNPGASSGQIGQLQNCFVGAPTYACEWNRYADFNSSIGCHNCSGGQIASATNGHRNTYCSSKSNFSCPSGTYGSPGQCNNCPANATCSGGSSFSCGAGYYQSGSVCATCPANTSSCSGSSFTCKSGYYKSGSTCVTCPANTSSCGGSSFSCIKGYYRNGNNCVMCPALNGIAATTSGNGATSISSCYLPAGSYASDVTGTYTYESNCAY